MVGIAMVSITISRVAIRSISRPLVVAMVGIRVGSISMVSITISRVAIGSLSISRSLVVAMMGITISMVSIAIGRVAIAIRNSMMASISFRLSCNSCQQAKSNNSYGFH